MGKHAVLSPSSSGRWSECHAAPWAEFDTPNESSEFADEGTLAHALLANVLENDRFAKDFIGLPFAWEHDGKETISTISNSMAEYVDDVAARVREAAFGKTLFVECRMSIEQITREKGAEGTSDIVILDDETIEIRDLKYGMGVKVFVKENTQLISYAISAVDEFAWFADFKKVRVVIDQPRMDHYDVWECSREELEKWRAKLRKAASRSLEILKNGCDLDGDDFKPSRHACKFCRASGSCKAQAKRALELAAGEFDIENAPASISERIEVIESPKYPVDKLAVLAEAIPFLKDFVNAVDKKLNSLLMNGVKVPGWKLVVGRAGNAKYVDENEAAEIMLEEGIDRKEVYEESVISPATAKKKFEKKRPELWEKLEPVIVRSPGKPNAVPEDDPREVYKVPNGADDFEV